jgi:hypothetical protein
MSYSPYTDIQLPKHAIVSFHDGGQCVTVPWGNFTPLAKDPLVTVREVAVGLSHAPYTSSPQIFQNPRSHLKILGAKRVTRGKFHTEDPKILGATGKNSVAQATWRPGFVYPCSRRCDNPKKKYFSCRESNPNKWDGQVYN